jgi:GDP-mannose 6-dehydrogenase
MNISIFGLGYVGAVTAACLARDGHYVVGVDISPEKVKLLACGKSPIIEPGLEDWLAEGVGSGRIRTTTDALAAALATEVSLISVGTPPTEEGGPNLHYVYNVCRQIGAAIAEKGRPHVVVLRSTVPPGTLECCSDILSEAAGDVPVHVAFNPEFLREGAAIHDYDNPPYTVIGTTDAVAEEAVRRMYASIQAPVLVVEPAVAEMVKYVANTWHATKIAFANEIGRVAKASNVDGREVMNLIVQDTKLNVSPAYMRPGFAYGGSCLPKDLGALLYYARAKNVETPLLSAVPVSNELMIEAAFKAVLRLKAKRIAVLGLAFKHGTDDLRESPAVPLVKRLLGEGCEVKIYDAAVYHANLMGANLSFIQQNLPHFERLLHSDLDEVLKDAELVVVTYAAPEFQEGVLKLDEGAKVLDLAGLKDKPAHLEYGALGW